jgi:hypothetical protein
MLRAFPTVLGIALSVTSGSQLQELTFDVDISPHTWSFNSDPLFKRFLTNNTIERIPIVRFQVLRGRQSSEAVSWHCKKFASFMREKRFTTRDMIYFTEEVRSLPLPLFSSPSKLTPTLKGQVNGQFKFLCLSEAWAIYLVDYLLEACSSGEHGATYLSICLSLPSVHICTCSASRFVSRPWRRFRLGLSKSLRMAASGLIAI